MIASGFSSEISARTTIPLPLVIQPSEYWYIEARPPSGKRSLTNLKRDGVDGIWSSFAVRIGQPAQSVRVMVSTNSPATMVVVPAGCTEQAFQTTATRSLPADCANARGTLFNPNSSITWDDQGDYGINADGVGFEANLGYSLAADYGLDTVGLDFASNGPTLDNQTVMGFATTSPFYL